MLKEETRINSKGEGGRGKRRKYLKGIIN